MGNSSNTSEMMVSIWCLTYNHVNYIRDTLEGFLMQDTDFLYEIVIYDDASTDGTSDIVKEYAKKYPKMMKAIIAKKNTYHNPDRWKIILDLKRKYLTGKYIAHCEGDDLWIDSQKLRLQVEYMERHMECSMHLHNALWLNCKDGSMKAGNHYIGADEQDVSAEEIIMQYRYHPPMASMMYRRELNEKPFFFLEAPVGDYPLLLYALTKGVLHYTNRIMSLYRWQSNGSYSSRVKEDKDLLFHFNMGLLDFFVKYDRYTNYDYHTWCINKIQLFASGILDNVDCGIPIKNSLRRSQKNGYIFSKECEEYIPKLEMLRTQIFNRTYCSNNMKKFLNRFKKIVIMGAGKYGEIVENQFVSNHINFEGFVVSQNDDKDYYLGKPVWILSELPFDKNDIGVVIAINPLRWDTIQKALNDAGINNYYCPFLFHLSEVQ